MSEVSILDASAVLAYLQAEKGHERLEAGFEAGPCWISAVNLCEVLGKLCDVGMTPPEARSTVDDLALTIVDFDAESAELAASLRLRTKSIGASLGDRACLALAERAAQRRPPPVVYTADRTWTRLRWPFAVRVLR